MKIKFTNCNNIDSGEISVVENTLNIKYAINGTGKTTMARALKCCAEKDEEGLLSLRPYKYIGQDSADSPTVAIEGAVSRVAIFDEEYLNTYAFQQDDLLKDSFEVLVKTQKYEEHMREIEKITKSVSDVFGEDEDLTKLISDFEEFEKGFGKSKTGYAENGSIAKGIGKGNKISNVPEELFLYKPYLGADASLEWLEWCLDGQQYLGIADTCPYCTSELKPVQSRIKLMSDYFDIKEIKNYNKMAAVFRALERYFSDGTKAKVDLILNKKDELSPQEKSYLVEIKKQAVLLKKQLQDLKSLSFGSFANPREVESKLGSMKIDLSYYSHMQSKQLQEKVAHLNSSLDEVLGLAKKLPAEVGKQQALIQFTVEKNQKAINEFLQIAGYQYKVSHEEQPDGAYKLMLRPAVKMTEEVIVGRNHLSYGERNALALALFMFSALKEKADLIVLDDPISSFDNNKKFALIDLLFLRSAEECFRGKTVLMLTHDMGPVIDVMKVGGIHKRFAHEPHAHFICNHGGVLFEKPITNNDIQNAIEMARQGVCNAGDVLLKAIYMRRYVELMNWYDSPVYNLLSNLLHKRQVPTLGVGEDIHPMPQQMIQEASGKIAERIPDFDYEVEYKKTQDVSFLKSLYKSATSNWEKLQLFRLIYIDDLNSKLTDVQRKFVNEAYHIENDYLFQVDPCKYDTVPDFIIKELDDVVGNDN